MHKTIAIRKKFLTQEPVQIKYLVLLVISMVVPAIVVGACLYFLIINIMAEQLGIPESIAYHLFPVIKKINFIIIVGFPAIFLFVLLWGVILSHRFAGPLQRLRQELEAMALSGDFNRRLRIRKTDEIRPLADAINNVIDKACEGKRK